MKKSRFLKYHLPFWFIAASIFTASSIPGYRLPEAAFILSDKLIHLLIYMVFFFTAAWMFKNRERYGRMKKHYLVSGLTTVTLYGMTDEFHQFFVPNRSCDFYDFVFDVLGGITGLILMYIIFHKRKNNLVIQND